MKSYVAISKSAMRAKMKALGLSYQQMADRLGVVVHTLKNQIHKERMPQEQLDMIKSWGNAGLPAVVKQSRKRYPSDDRKKERTGDETSEMTRVAVLVPSAQLGVFLVVVQGMGGKILGLQG